MKRSMWYRVGFGLVLIGISCYASLASAGTVHSCEDQYKKVEDSFEVKKTTQCVLELTQGKIGDTVEIKNESNYIVAVGKIINKKGKYAVVILKEVYKDVRSGYLVIIKNSDSIDYWTATMAPY